MSSVRKGRQVVIFFCKQNHQQNRKLKFFLTTNWCFCTKQNPAYFLDQFVNQFMTDENVNQ